MPSAYFLAVKLLSRREYTTAELTRKLADRECSKDEIEAAITRLRESGALDDRRAGAAHVRTATRLKGRGRLRIERELMARGLDRGLARELLADASPDDQLAALKQVLLRKRVPASLDQAAYRRVFQQLARRGFAADVIAKALRSRRRGGEDDD